MKQEPVNWIGFCFFSEIVFWLKREAKIKELNFAEACFV